MASEVERLRRMSYAGLSVCTTQKSRRFSQVPSCGIEETSHQQSAADSRANHVVVANASNNNNNAMLQNLEGGLNMSSHRSARRTSRPSEDGIRCSQQSVLTAMDRFVKAVNNMDATVLVPSRLQDMDIQSNGKLLNRFPPALSNTDLHSFYNMLHEVKNELLWGPGTTATATMAPASTSTSGRSSPRELKHVRQPSDDSLGSTASTGSSSDQDTDSEAESVLTDRDSGVDEHTSHLAAAFRNHLQGLHTILHQLADSADYLAVRYQEEVDASAL